MEVSIIIPCFNHGLFIDDAINSIKQLKNIDYEVIIIDDGSTDPLTLSKLEELKIVGYQVISHTNKGPAYSRNAGIKIAQGKYILPLDADNKIKPEYIYKGVEILKGGQYDIVYANPIFFGEAHISREFKTKAFDGNDLFVYNYIDTCALFKKEVWDNIGGYDENMPFYQEDWEFWVHAFVKGYRFYHLDEELYFYRVLSNSITTGVETEKSDQNHNYILRKHISAFAKTMFTNYSAGKMYQTDQKNPLRASLKYLSYFLKIKK